MGELRNGGRLGGSREWLSADSTVLMSGQRDPART